MFGVSDVPNQIRVHHRWQNGLFSADKISNCDFSKIEDKDMSTSICSKALLYDAPKIFAVTNIDTSGHGFT